MSDELLVLLLLLALCGWTGFCALMNRRAAPLAVPPATDPGADACAALTALQPLPSGRHRNPCSPLPPFTYRTNATGGSR